MRDSKVGFKNHVLSIKAVSAQAEEVLLCPGKRMAAAKIPEYEFLRV